MSMADQLCLFSRFSFGFLFRLTRLLWLTRRFRGICGDGSRRHRLFRGLLRHCLLYTSRCV